MDFCFVVWGMSLMACTQFTGGQCHRVSQSEHPFYRLQKQAI